jgi:hypothetical protein
LLALAFKSNKSDSLVVINKEKALHSKAAFPDNLMHERQVIKECLEN